MTQLASDNFDRADANPIGGNWTTAAGESAIQIVSNAVQPTVLNNCAAFYNAVNFPNDQYSEATIVSASSANSFPSVMVRQSSTQNQYLLQPKNPPLSATCGLQLTKRIANAQTLLASDSLPLNAGDVIRLEVMGTTLTAKRNGVVRLTVTDSSLSSGNVGIWIFEGDALANSVMDNWAAGDLLQSALAFDDAAVGPISIITSGNWVVS